MVILNHLTDFSRLLARRVFRNGPVDHKKSTTLSRTREKSAFGGPDRPVDFVVKLARYQYRAAFHALPSEPIWPIKWFNITMKGSN